MPTLEKYLLVIMRSVCVLLLISIDLFAKRDFINYIPLPQMQ